MGRMNHFALEVLYPRERVEPWVAGFDKSASADDEASQVDLPDRSIEFQKEIYRVVKLSA